MHRLADLLPSPPPKDAGRAPVADFGCPRCGGLLLTREGRFGDFKGCENYPECQYTETISGWRHRREMR